MAGIKKLGCLGVLSRKTSKNPQKDESYLEGFRTDPYGYMGNMGEGEVEWDSGRCRIKYTRTRALTKALYVGHNTWSIKARKKKRSVNNKKQGKRCLELKGERKEKKKKSICVWS